MKAATHPQGNRFSASMARSRFAMNLKVLCKKLEIDPSRVLNLYVIGSRIWGTATSKSDWDVIVVVDNKTKMKHRGQSVKVDNIDAVIWDKEEWIEEVKAHRFVCWLTLFLPSTAIWKQEMDICSLSANMKGFGLRLFVDELMEEVGEDCKKLNKFWSKGEMDKVHRTFVHSLRMIQVSKSVVTLMKEKYSVSSDAIVSCQQMKADEFVGSIHLHKIDGNVREKMEEMSGEQAQNVESWISYLKEQAQSDI